MRVAVLGAGSLGSLLAGMLAQVQTAEVLIHGKGEHGAMMVAKGLHIEGEATFHLSQDAALFTLEEVGIPTSLERYDGCRSSHGQRCCNLRFGNPR